MGPPPYVRYDELASPVTKEDFEELYDKSFKDFVDLLNGTEEQGWKKLGDMDLDELK